MAKRGNPAPRRRPAKPPNLRYQRPAYRGLVEWEWWLGWLAAVRREFGPVTDWPVAPRESCRIVVTGFPGSNGRLLSVRCRCMTGTVHPAARNFYAYDRIGIAGSLKEAMAMWRGHHDKRAAEDGKLVTTIQIGDHDERADHHSASYPGSQAAR